MAERNKLLALNFLLGFLPLALEVLAIRALAPVVGTGIIATSLCIATIILCLSFGYYLASKADEKDANDLLRRGFVGTSLLLLLSPFILQLLKHWAGEADYSNYYFLKMILIGFCGPLVLAGLCTVALGFCSPLVFELLKKHVHSNRQAASIAFISSGLGGLLGSLSPNLLLIPWIGINRSLLFLFVLSSVASLAVSVGNFRRFVLSSVIVLSMALGADLLVQKIEYVPRNAIEKIETAHQTIYLKQTEFLNRPILAMVYDLGFGWQSIYDEDYFSLQDPYYSGPLLPFNRAVLSDWNPDQTFQVLVLGSGAATMNRHAHRAFEGLIPKFKIFNVDIDEGVHKLAQEKFRSNGAQGVFVSMDGRTFVRTTQDKFDYVMIDAFGQGLFVPSELLTFEFFRELTHILKPQGIIQINIFAFSEESELMKLVLGGLQKSFRHTYVVRCPSGVNSIGDNYLITASSDAIDFAALANVKTDIGYLATGWTAYSNGVHPATLSNAFGSDDSFSSEFVLLSSLSKHFMGSP